VADPINGGSSNLRLVRLRPFLALITMFAIPIAITTPSSSLQYSASLKRQPAAGWPTARELGPTHESVDLLALSAAESRAHDLDDTKPGAPINDDRRRRGVAA